ncbi:MAG: FlgD immunoglobulin-like domain containing protein, partial [Anaerolineales bacterium]|nr:FlgD immunoglobulin-like domain containing protein [Anaerolineales bacterium]
LRFDTTGSTTIIGHPINELVISLTEGWNLVSGLHEDISIYSINDPDSTIVPNTLFGFSDAYFLTEELVPGKGYWLRAFQDGEVTITGDGLARVTSQDFSLNDRANTLTINDMDLYFGIEMSAREKLSYSLPPKPPSGAFDIRFKGDTRVTKEKAEIEVMSTTETLTIAYNVVIDAGEHMNWVLTSDNGKDYILDDSGEITVPSSERFVLNRESVIPVTFALHQNYPNPFNPITTLRYDLPSDALVTLSIYDMLGREITQLVNTTQEAGFKSVQWDATDSMGRTVSAGVYLYQIQAGDPSPNSGHGFVQTKKMVLLK